jgi:flagellar biosynthesis/type III secretory pathway M-ring protein FliF/YscJ
MSMPEMDIMPPIDGEMFPEEQNQNFFMKIVKNPVVWGVFVFVVILVAAIIITRKVRKRQEAMMLDE